MRMLKFYVPIGALTGYKLKSIFALRCFSGEGLFQLSGFIIVADVAPIQQLQRLGCVHEQ
jgi:hypothetical protein